MSNPMIVPALIGGSALLLLTSGKKRSKKKSEGLTYTAPKNVPPVYKGSAPKQVSSSWKERQEALKALASVKVRAPNGNSFPLCSRCDPGKIDGVVGPKTRSAVKAFQAIAGLEVTGEWGALEEGAMFHFLSAISAGNPIPCDPNASYPKEFACIALGGGKHGLQAKSLPAVSGDRPATPGSTADDEPFVPETPKYRPDELLVADPECNYILHQDDKWFDVQKERVIRYALDGMFDSEAATEINESMLADYIPLCLTLGRDGVGPGVKQFWDANAVLIYNQLQAYEALPDMLEEDAREYGIL